MRTSKGREDFTGNKSGEGHSYSGCVINDIGVVCKGGLNKGSMVPNSENMKPTERLRSKFIADYKKKHARRTLTRSTTI